MDSSDDVNQSVRELKLSFDCKALQPCLLVIESDHFLNRRQLAPPFSSYINCNVRLKMGTTMVTASKCKRRSNAIIVIDGSTNPLISVANALKASSLVGVCGVLMANQSYETRQVRIETKVR